MSSGPSRLLLAFVGLIVVFLEAPTIIVIVMSLSPGRSLQFPPPGISFRWYERFLGSSIWTDAAWTSLQVSLASTPIATILGTLVGLGLTRSRLRAKNLATGLVLSPLVVPVVIIAVGMFVVYSRWGIRGSLVGLVLAHATMAIPFVVVNVSASLRQVDRNLELAAQNLGATPLRTFWRVTLPLIRPGITAGALFAFITSWDEIVISVFLSSPQVRTLPVVMWGQIHSEVDPTIAAVATVLTVVTTVALTLVVLVRPERIAAAR